MIAPELNEEKDAKTRECSNSGDVEEVLDVAVPYEVVESGRRWRG